jgi:diaminopimelate epimerase
MTEAVRIVKMSGAGNDFVVLGPDEAARLGNTLPSWSRGVCRRGLSVGADGVLVVRPTGSGRVEVTFLNPDGSVAFCGNGARCAARFAHRHRMADARMVLETAVGDVPAEVTGERVRIVMPPPEDLGPVRLELGGQILDGRRIAAGVPHFVVFVPDPGQAPIEEWGPAVRRHPTFGPEGTNLDVATEGPGPILVIRTWERGVEGETLACGTGAVAAAMARRLAGGETPIPVLPASGVGLTVDLPGPADRPDAAILEGDARWILEGTVEPEAVSDEMVDR